jgi:hypothetical protein
VERRERYRARRREVAKKEGKELESEMTIAHTCKRKEWERVWKDTQE